MNLAEGSRGLFEGTVTVFAWKYRGKLMKTHVMVAGNAAKSLEFYHYNKLCGDGESSLRNGKYLYCSKRPVYLQGFLKLYQDNEFPYSLRPRYKLMFP
jgi:hypothetical protein